MKRKLKRLCLCCSVCNNYKEVYINLIDWNKHWKKCKLNFIKVRNLKYNIVQKNY